MLLTYQENIVKWKNTSAVPSWNCAWSRALAARVSCTCENNLLLLHPHQICMLRSSYMLLPSFITNKISYWHGAFLFHLFLIDTDCSRGETGPYSTMMGSNTFMVLNARLNARLNAGIAWEGAFTKANSNLVGVLLGSLLWMKRDRFLQAIAKLVFCFESLSGRVFLSSRLSGPFSGSMSWCYALWVKSCAEKVKLNSSVE